MLLLPLPLRRASMVPRLARSYLVDTSSSVKADERLLAKLTRAAGQKLSVRALVVDAQLFRRVVKGQERVASPLAFDHVRGDSSKIATRDMLTKAVREELRSRGLDGVGKPWVVRDRLNKAREEEGEIASLEVAIGGERPAAPAADAAAEVVEAKPEKEAPSGGGIAAKYAAKLAAKRQSGGGGGGDAGPAVEAPGQVGDAATLFGARELAALDDERRNDSKWRMGPPGMKNLLTFASKRSMALALVARPDTGDQELEELISQAGVVFDVVTRPSDDALHDALNDLDLEPHRVLAFADDLDFVLDAKRKRLHTCILDDDDRPLPARHDRRPDHNVPGCSDVCHVINELNGISWRAPGPG